MAEKRPGLPRAIRSAQPLRRLIHAQVVPLRIGGLEAVKQVERREASCGPVRVAGRKVDPVGKGTEEGRIVELTGADLPRLRKAGGACGSRGRRAGGSGGACLSERGRRGGRRRWAER